MFITCQECNTTFRLDESLLKPTGSKVRCSQCHHTFVAKPPSAPAPVAPPVVDVPKAAPTPPPEPEPEPESQELEGIDLAELDSILEGKSDFSDAEALEDIGAPEQAPTVADADALEDIDLDFDFDAALESAEDTVVDEGPVEALASDDLDLDMDFEIDDDTLIAEPLTPEAVADEAELSLDATDEGGLESETGADDIALDDLDLDLALGDAAEESQAVKTEEKDDLDLADMDFDLDADVPAEAFEGEEPELSLDSGGEGAVPATGEAAADDLSLDLDFDLDDAGSEPDQAPADAELSLDDDFDLSLEEEPAAAEASPPGEELELDLGDDLDLEMDTMPGDDISSAKEPELEMAVAEEPLDDDLDLGDLDTLLDEGDGTSDLAEGGLGDLEDLELKLEMEESPKRREAEPVEDELEDLDFELDSEFVDNSTMQPLEATPPAASSDEEEEIDLSDIEQMLEDDSQGAVKTPSKPVAPEDLDLGGGGDEIDLSEFESAIDLADSGDTGGLEEDTELELDLELDSEKPKAAAVPSDDLSLELDLDADESRDEVGDLDLDLDLDLSLDDEPKTLAAEEEELDLSDLSDLVEEADGGQKPNTITDGDIELEFQIEEDEEVSDDDLEPMPVGQTAGGRVEQVPLEQTMETLMVEEKAAARAPVRPKKKKSGSLVSVLILLLLLGALAGAVYYAVTQMGVEIPYVSEYLKPKPKDPAGILKLSTMEINAKFIENSQTGRLFVITGKVRNGYNTSRNLIRLQGKLFTKGKVLVKSEYSYAGVALNDQELASLPIAEIKQRLNAGPQAPGSVKPTLPGQNIAFMVVFSDLPKADQLDEYAVELVSSAKAQ